MSALLSHISLLQISLVVVVTAVSAVLGGIAGYGTGPLMPLVLVPLVGAKPVVPIIAISSMFTNGARLSAFRNVLHVRLALMACAAALPTCILGAWLYTLLSGRGAAIVIGSTLIATVPVRRVLKRRGHQLGEKAFTAAAAGWGVLVGGTSGAGVVLLSLLLASGLESTAVIATDSAISLATGVLKLSTFGLAGLLTPTVIAIGLLMGLIGFPCTFLAKLIVARIPVHVHTAILDVIVIVGGTVMIIGALID
ncbi:MAG TPA: TSUP family transporter [Xanthobacteraceae bacterium]|nr:TSUP family transporter [Xanthobacteraceae bacterium]